MVIILTFLHVLICVFLVIVVLLQSGKAADLAGAFGGMGSQTAFGPRGSATVLSKATTIAAALFMVTSLTLAIMQSRASGGATSVVERSKGAASKTAAPAPAAPSNGAKPPAPSVTITPVGPGGEKGPSRTEPLPMPARPGETGAPAAPKK
jgi:preprotein translocase subunit SecG